MDLCFHKNSNDGDQHQNKVIFTNHPVPVLSSDDDKLTNLNSVMHEGVLLDEEQEIPGTGNGDADLRVTDDESVDIASSNCSLSEDVAFAIDHIIELVFITMDPDTLFDCRLVSKRWRYFASKQLQKFITITLGQPERPGSIRIRSSPPASFFRTSDSFLIDLNHPIEVLIDVLTNSTDFPCKAFKFYQPDALSPSAQCFFDTHGSYITKLELGWGTASDRCIYCVDVKRLLLIQVPLLTHLTLNSRVVYGASPWRRDPLQTKSEDMFSHEVEPDTSLYDYDYVYGLHNRSESNLRLNLRALKIKDEIPKNFLMEILGSSPKLQEVQLLNKHLNLLVQPINRLHLLKELKIRLEKGTIDSLEELINHHGKNWALKILDVRRSGLVSVEKENLLPRALNVLDQVLEGAGAELERLAWCQMPILNGVQFPQVLPKVKYLALHLCFEKITLSKCSEDNILPCLPRGTYLNETFPNLQCIDFASRNGLYITYHVPATRLFHNSEPVQSVTKVILGDLSENESFRKMFPNAKFV